MLESVLSALKTMPVPPQFLERHPHPKMVTSARAGLETPATERALRKHYAACPTCQDFQTMIDEVARVAGVIIAECMDGRPVWTQAELN